MRGYLRPGSPRVSAAIPAYNAERFLADAIRSVLGQTQPPFECLIIDDGSTDSTADVARSYEGVRCISQPNGGDAHARNRAIAEAHGDLIAFLDADDVWLPRKLELQMELFSHRPELGMVYSGIFVVDERLHRIEELHPATGEIALRNTLLVEKPYMTGVGSSGVVRTDVARRVLFDERLRASSDWAFACAVAMVAPVDRVPQALVLYRQHGSGQVHRDLGAIDADFRLVWNELVADGTLDPELRRLRRRAFANLHLSLAAGYHRDHDFKGFLRHLMGATVLRPDRVARAFWRRYMGPSTA